MPVNLKSARDFVYANGTLWERALFAYLFQNQPIERLHACLLNYKNPDGGFGHALEPDARCPDSHPLALEFLLGMMIKCGVPAGNLLEGSATWIERSREIDGSLKNPPAFLEYPHAPWWSHGGQTAPDSILGNLAYFGAASESLLTSTAAWAESNLSDAKIRANDWLFMAYHAYDYYANITSAPNHADLWRATLDNIVACGISAKPEQYYEMLSFAPTPDSPVARALPDGLLTTMLDHLENSQGEDGGWHDEHELPQWYAYTTILVLNGLRRHGRQLGAI